MTDQHLMKVIGRNVRALRESRLIKIADLAQLLGISEGFVGLVERGMRGTTAFMLKRLSEFFAVQVDYFFEDDSAEVISEKPVNLRYEAMKSLTADFTDEEFDFILACIRNYRALRADIGGKGKKEEDS